MAAKKVAALVCLVLTLVIIADMLMPEKALAAGGASDLSVSKGGEKAKAVLHVEKPSWQKMTFGIGMLIAGILSLKYL